MNMESKNNKLNLWLILMVSLIFINLLFINFKLKDLKTEITKGIFSKIVEVESQKQINGVAVSAEKEASQKSPVTFEYSNNKIYNIFAKVNNMVTIKLEKGEKLESGFIGDLENWMVGNTSTANGEIIFIKPLAEKLNTNITLVTNKRMYLLNVESTSDKYNPVIEWNYSKEKAGNLGKSEKGKDLWKDLDIKKQ